GRSMGGDAGGHRPGGRFQRRCKQSHRPAGIVDGRRPAVRGHPLGGDGQAVLGCAV
ncbi:MAG: hypothetical protein AVDCRST_MAG51-313, partial [uncultured Ramlibacter sp.]